MSAMADISFTEGGERLINTLHTHLYSPPSQTQKIVLKENSETPNQATA